jgi:hypothetical protein
MFNLPAKPAEQKCAGHDGQPEFRRKPEQATVSLSHDVDNRTNLLLGACSMSKPEPAASSGVAAAMSIVSIATIDTCLLSPRRGIKSSLQSPG